MTKSILAIETCSESCSVALLHEEKHQQLLSTEPRGHADNVLPMVEQLMADAKVSLSELDGIAFTRGPGAFTGVRIGTSVAQGLALASGLPLVAVSSLAVLAQGSYRETGINHCLAALDARMSEVYFGVYQVNDAGIMIAIQDDQVAKPEQLQLLDENQHISNQQNWQAMGAGWTNYQDLMANRFKEWNLNQQNYFLYPQAQDLIIQAIWQFDNQQTVDPAQALPVYIRDRVVS